MKWKTNKTQPVIKDSQKTIAIMDITGRINYNLKLEGRGKMTKIAGKKWDDIKEDVIFWQYSDVIETSLKKNLSPQIRYWQ